jgi:hypothetical protein
MRAAGLALGGVECVERRAAGDDEGWASRGLEASQQGIQPRFANLLNNLYLRKHPKRLQTRRVSVS